MDGTKRLPRCFAWHGPPREGCPLGNSRREGSERTAPGTADHSRCCPRLDFNVNAIHRMEVEDVAPAVVPVERFTPTATNREALIVLPGGEISITAAAEQIFGLIGEAQ